MTNEVRYDVNTKIDQYHFTKKPYCLDGNVIDDLDLPNFSGKEIFLLKEIIAVNAIVFGHLQ
jgi:hypothetical protein